MTYNPFRLRIAPGGKVLREETEPNGGQWWSAQDNYGKTWWVDGGRRSAPSTSGPIAYGAFNVSDNFEPDFQVPWPAAGGIADMQGGMNRVRMPDGTLNHFTAASRCRDLPRAPLAAGHGRRSVLRRAGRRDRAPGKVVVRDGLTQLQNAYPKSGSWLHRSAVPPGCRAQRAGWFIDRRRHVYRHHPGRAVRRPEFVLRRKVEQYKLDATAQLRSHPEDHLRRHRTRPSASAHARDAGAAW